jgi:hypothetical protein
MKSEQISTFFIQFGKNLAQALEKTDVGIEVAEAKTNNV